MKLSFTFAALVAGAIRRRLLAAGMVAAATLVSGSSFAQAGAQSATPVLNDKIHAAPLAQPRLEPADAVQYFDAHVRPVLAQNCYKCHTSEAMGGLNMASREALLKGGDSGAAIVPGDPDKSLLIQAVQQTGELKMPPRAPKLGADEIAALAKWVKMGAAWDAAEAAQPVVATLTPTEAKSSAGDEFFENKVRPVLANQCGSCHQDRSAGGLSMNSREAMLQGGKSGAAIVPGDPDKSLLLTAVHQTGELKMPLRAAKLSDADIAALSDWVKMGAPWPATSAAIRPEGKQITPEMRQWWSFVPLKAPAIPADNGNGWAKSDIDRLVLAKLQAKGLEPAVPADRRTLIRRATLDLTGLPPTLAEVQAFEADKSPNAFAKVVDRLLASPQYGERWGRHWLDVARYADDDIRGLDPRGRGYMPLNGAYVYRDWVVKAVNSDLSYDQFIRMQLAGDMMSKHPDRAQLEATSFLGAAPWIWDQAEPAQGRADERNERIDAVTRGMLGLTVACARCHDHKYDPILAKDYYSLGGIFASSTYKEYALVPQSEVAYWHQQFDATDHMDDAVQAYNKVESAQLAKAMAAQAVPYMVAAWQVTGKPKMKAGTVADKAQLDPEQLDRWIAFLARKPSYYPYLHDWQMMIAQGGAEDQARALATGFQTLINDLEYERTQLDKENAKIKARFNGDTVRVKDAKPNDFDTYNQFCPGCRLELKVMTAQRANLYTDMFQYSLAASSETHFEPGLFVYHGWGLRRRLGQAQGQYLAQLETEDKKLHKSVPPEYPFVHGIADKAQVHDIALDLRGNPHTLGPIVPRAFPTVLRAPNAKPYTDGSGRLELANDIVASPLAARVWVNRVWKWHFGTGIVNTPDNFGKVGDPPSDPELLDYLAIYFRQHGMSLKALQREILLSATYQQSTHETPDDHVKDADNRLYSHFSLQRLDAEQMRDSVLFVAGDLDLSTLGGAPTPLDVKNTRRTIYGKVSRFRIDPFLQAFDFPVPSFTSEQRFSTNVPVQRLYFMNNAFIYAQAGKLADRVYVKGDDKARIIDAYQLLFQRDPTPDELALGLEFLKSTPEKPGYVVDQEPLTAWKQYARALFSSNEFEFLN